MENVDVRVKKRRSSCVPLLPLCLVFRSKASSQSVSWLFSISFSSPSYKKKKAGDLLFFFSRTQKYCPQDTRFAQGIQKKVPSKSHFCFFLQFCTFPCGTFGLFILCLVFLLFCKQEPKKKKEKHLPLCWIVSFSPSFFAENLKPQTKNSISNERNFCVLQHVTVCCCCCT